MAKRRKLEVSLLKLTTEQFFYSEHLPSAFKKSEIEMNNSVQLGIEPSQLMLACLFRFEVTKDDKELLVIEAGAHFKAEKKDFDKLYNKKEKTFIIPLETTKIMLVVAIGAARGMLHAKTEGTEISGLIIPLIDPDSVIQTDVVIPLTENE
ncbi:hypothetical protein [Flavobacterium sp. ABG]|uniref:hypothetical protein n=1 Tax=Flavobacterium sp. ABG TaxID=1423322 RepID=UPI00064A79D6|nr:hypothetical protein [Flavobacterium sp. ABG]KLT68943.1 hypothetical protein AB674_15360 [Flavobacterium sp. ABG]